MKHAHGASEHPQLKRATHSLFSLQNSTTQPGAGQKIRETRRCKGKQNEKLVEVNRVNLGARGRGGEGGEGEGKGTRNNGADGVGVVVNCEKHFLGVEVHELAA